MKGIAAIKKNATCKSQGTIRPLVGGVILIIWNGHALRKFVSASVRSEQAVEQNSQHEQRDPDVQIVTLDGERHCRKCNSRDRSCDEEKQAKLDDRAPAHVQRALDDPGHAFQCLWLAMKDAVAGHLLPVTGEVHNRPEQNDSSRQNDAGSQQRADDDFNSQVVPTAGAHSRPVAPLKIISNPSTTMTAANTYRNILTLALTSTRAPMREPASTPNITGMATPGAM